MAGRGAEGAGDRRPHLRDHDRQERRRSTTTPTRARRSTRASGSRQRRRTPRSPRHAARSSPTRASRSSPTSSRPRAGARSRSRTRRWAASRAVAAVGRGRVRQRVAAPPLADEADDAARRRRSSASLGQGLVQGHQGGRARRLAADRVAAEVVGSRGHTRRRRDAARAPRALRHLGVLHGDQGRGRARPRRTTGRRDRTAPVRIRHPQRSAACCAAR